MRHPVDRYVNRLLRRRRPRSFAPTEDELAVVRTAINLIAAAPDADEPRPAFVERLHSRLAELDRSEQGVDVESPRPAWRIPARRRVLAAGALTAASAAFGAAGDRLVVVAGGAGNSDGDGDGDGDGANGAGNGGGSAAGPGSEISPAAGVWRTVTDSSGVPEGAVLQFDLGAVSGFVRRVSGRVQAVSGICTHQGCRLDLTPARDGLSCPCHGATFTLAGANLTHPLQTREALPALPRLAVREQDGQIQVYAPRST